MTSSTFDAHGRPMDFPVPAAEALPSERAAFIRRTYTHLAGAVLAFASIEFLLFQTPLAGRIAGAFMGSRFGWLLALGGFMVVSWIADRWARSPQSVGKQYLGLGLYVVAEAFIFVPLLFFARHFEQRLGQHLIAKAGVITLALFAGLTMVVFVTRKDFSFLRSFLVIGGFVAMGLIVAGIIFGFTLGIVFVGAMILFASAAILYSTSNILHHYGTGQHVAAALSLFAAVALLFWYVLRFVLSMASND